MTTLNQRKGFTLIELLVVIAVIGILASVILVGLSGARARGRDARRLGDIKSVQNALELYFSANGFYPTDTTWDALKLKLTGAGIGITQVPDDPDPSKDYGYCPMPVGSTAPTSYVVGAGLEQNDPALASTFSTGCAPSGITCTQAGKGFCASI